MRVALTLRVTNAAGYHEPRDSISHDWLARLAEWAMTPLLIPNRLAEPAAYLDGMEPDLLVLTGGDDVGATPERDATEAALLDHALARGLAILGVCRGMQLVNLRLGGTLGPVAGHVAQPHPVAIEPAWHGIYGAETTVNSFHAHGIPAAALAPGLVAAARDGDGNVEAFHGGARPMAAVMWHPERPAAPAADRRLLERLAGEGAFWQ